MPTYDYKCKKCGEIQEVIHKMSECTDSMLKKMKCSICSKTSKHKRMIGGGSGVNMGTDVMDYIRKARKKHGFAEDRGPQQDAIDKYTMEKRVGVGKFEKRIK